MSNYSYCFERLLFPFLLFTSMLLAGCMGSSVNLKPPITKETPIDRDGVVVARIINATGSVLPFNQLTLTPKTIHASKDNKYERLVSIDESDGSSLFASSVPVGEYSIENIRSFYMIGEYIYSVWAPGGLDLGVFNVEPGKITDLGAFIFYRKIDGKNYVNKLIRVPQTDNQVFINHYKSFLNYNKSTALTWTADDLNTERYSNYVAVAQNPTAFTERYIDNQGTLYFAGKLGAIIERKKTGEWSQEMLETNSDIVAISRSDKGQLIVGGDQGALFFKGVDGKWRDLSFDVGTKVGGVKFLPSGEVILLTAQNDSAVILKGNPKDEKPKWQTLSTYTATKGWCDVNGVYLSTGELLDPSMNSDANPSTNKKSKNTVKVRKIIDEKLRVYAIQLESFLGKDYIRVTVQKSGHNKKFELFDELEKKLFSVTDDIKTLHYESGLADKMDGIVSAGNASLGIKKAGFWSWTGKDSYYRYDPSTKDWTEMNTYINNCPSVVNSSQCVVNGKRMSRKSQFNFLSVPVFVTADKAYATIRSLAFESKSELVKTTDGGQSWTKLESKLPGELCADIAPEITDKILLYCSGVSGDFYESTDEGKNWKHVRQQENF